MNVARESHGLADRTDYLDSRILDTSPARSAVRKAISTSLLGLGALTLSGLPLPAHAVDGSAAIIGTTYGAVMGNAPAVIAGNMSVAAPLTSTAHQRWAARVNYCYSDPSGNVQACQLFSTLYHEFLTSPTCAGHWRCGFTEAYTYGVKHQHGLFDTIVSVISVAQWAYESFNWCTANAVACGTFGSNMCEAEGFSCSSDSVLGSAGNDITVGLTYTPYLIADGEDLVGLNTGGTDWAFYGSPYGWGSWGVLDELGTAGCVDDMGMWICF